MAVVDLVIADCDEKFARMVVELHAAYAKGMKFKHEANFSGKVGDFKYRYSDLDPTQLYAIVTKTEGYNGQSDTIGRNSGSSSKLQDQVCRSK